MTNQPQTIDELVTRLNSIGIPGLDFRKSTAYEGQISLGWNRDIATAEYLQQALRTLFENQKTLQLRSAPNDPNAKAYHEFVETFQNKNQRYPFGQAELSILASVLEYGIQPLRQAVNTQNEGLIKHLRELRIPGISFEQTLSGKIRIESIQGSATSLESLVGLGRLLDQHTDRSESEIRFSRTLEVPSEAIREKYMDVFHFAKNIQGSQAQQMDSLAVETEHLRKLKALEI